MDRDRLVAILPQLAVTMVSLADVARVTLAQGAHQAGDATRAGGRQEKVYMVAHQHIGVHGAAEAGGVPAEPAEVRDAVLITEEARRPQMAALDHMQRVAGNLGTNRA